MILKICVLTLLVLSRNYIARTEGAAISPLPSFFANIEKRRCISRPNLAYLFPINSGHSVKISTPGHQMSGQQVTLCDLISTHFGNFAVCSSNSRRYSDLKLTECDETIYIYNLYVSDFAYLYPDVIPFLLTTHCESKSVGVSV